MAKKSGLGRGLESLMGGMDADVASLPPDANLLLSDIHPNPHQPRKVFDEAALTELADSIAQHGVLQPILVRRDGSGYEIVAGERRFQAAKRAGLMEIPAIVRDISDEDVFAIALIENLQREDLNPIEEAQGYRTLLDQTGMTHAELGKTLSKSRPAIANALRLLDLPDEIQGLVSEGLISAGHARAILAVGNEEGRLRLAKKVVEDGLTVRQTEKLAPLFSVAESVPPKREPLPPSYKRAAQHLRSVLKTNVRVKRVRNKNKVEIEFESEEDLARLVGLLSKEQE